MAGGRRAARARPQAVSPRAAALRGPRGPRPERRSTHPAGRRGAELRPRLAGAPRRLPSLLVASVRTPCDPGRHDAFPCFLNDNLAEEETGCQVLLGWLRGMCTFLFACVWLPLLKKNKINISLYFFLKKIFPRHCQDLMALLRLHNRRLWVCIDVCMCV